MMPCRNTKMWLSFSGGVGCHLKCIDNSSARIFSTELGRRLATRSRSLGTPCSWQSPQRPVRPPLSTSTRLGASRVRHTVRVCVLYTVHGSVQERIGILQNPDLRCGSILGCLIFFCCIGRPTLTSIASTHSHTIRCFDASHAFTLGFTLRPSVYMTSSNIQYRVSTGPKVHFAFNT